MRHCHWIVILAIIGAVNLAGTVSWRTATKRRHAPIAAWVKDEGFRIQSRDANWRLRVGLQMAAYYQPFFENGVTDWNNFGFAYVRPRVNGYLFRPWFEYWCSMELRNFPPILLDCFVDVHRWSFFGLRAGQFRTPLSRHENRQPQDVLFPDWATTANYFYPGRDRGVLLYGETPYLTITPASLPDEPDTDRRAAGPLPAGRRVMVNPLGKMAPTEMPYVTADGPVPFRFSLTGQGAWGRVNPNGVGFNGDAFFQQSQQGERDQEVVSCDLQVQWQQFGFFGEFYARHVQPRGVPTASFNQLGAWFQAHVTFYRRILDFGVRFDWIDRSTSLASDRFIAGEAQLVWFIYKTTLALRARYGVANQQNPGPSPPLDPGFLTTVGLPITPGTERAARDAPD